MGSELSLAKLIPEGPKRRSLDHNTEPVLRQNSIRRQVIDLAGLIQRKFRPYGHPLAPPASTASPPLRRSPPCRPGEPGLAPPARRLQEDGDPAEGVQDRPTLLGRAVEGVGGLEQALVIVSPNTVLRWQRRRF